MCKLKSCREVIMFILVLSCGAGVALAGSIPGSAGTVTVMDGPNVEGLYFEVDIHYEAFDGLDATDPLGVTPGKSQFAYILEYIDGNENVGKYDVESTYGVAIDATGTSTSGTVNGVAAGTAVPTGHGIITLTSGNPAARFLYNFFGQSQFGGIGARTVILVYTASSEHQIGDVLGIVTDNSLSAAESVIGPIECFGIIQGSVVCTTCEPDEVVVAMEGVTVSVLQGATVVATATTDSAGRYEVAALDPGDYTVVVEPGVNQEACSVSSVDVTVSCEEAATASFCLCPVCEQEICVKVVCAATGEEVPVPNARIKICGPGIYEWRCVGENGIKCFSGEKIIPGTYNIKVKAPEGYEVTGESVIEVVLGECEKKEVVFNVCPLPPCEPQVCIAVVETDDEGVEYPIDGVKVWLKRSSCKKYGITDSNGDICFEDLKPGHYKAGVVIPQGYRRCKGESKTVRFRLDRCENEEIKFVLCPVESNVCPEKPDFWHHNPHFWPATLPNVGGCGYSQNEMLNVCEDFVPDGSKKNKRDMSIQLAKYLIATKLSICDGADPTDVQALIEASDKFLTNYPPGSEPGGRPRKTARDLMNRLHEYVSDRNACEVQQEEEDDADDAGGEDDSSSSGE